MSSSLATKTKGQDVDVIKLHANSVLDGTTPELDHEDAAKLASHNLPDDDIGFQEATIGSHATREWKADRSVVIIMLCIAAVDTMFAFDASLVIPAMPAIADTLHASASEAFMVGTSYLIPYAIVQPITAAWCDSSDRLPLFLFSAVFCELGSSLAFNASNVNTMLLGRVFQGLGGGGIYCLTVVIAADVVPLQRRAKWLAIPQVAWTFGLMIGPLIGGAIAKGNWRWIFFINFPFCAVGIVFAPFILRFNRKGQLPFLKAFSRLDWPGIVLFTGGVSSCLVGISWGGERYPWTSYHIVTLLTIGGLLTSLSVLYEVRWAPRPFLKPYLYQNYSCIALATGTFLQGFLLYLAICLWNLYFAGAKAMSSLGFGIALLPAMAATTFASIATGFFLSKSNRYKVLLIFAAATITVGNTLVLYLWNTNTPKAVWAATQLVLGLGHGVFMISGNFTLQSHVDAKDSAGVAASLTFLRALGMACGAGMGGAIFQNRLTFWLKDEGLPATIAKNIQAHIPTLNMHLSGAQSAHVRAVRTAIVKAHQNVFEGCVVIGGIVFLLVIVVKEVNAKKHYASIGGAPGG